MAEMTNEQYHREMRARSLDTVRVHNPTDEDIILWDDKYGNSRQKILIPSGKKDNGLGRGNKDLPRYLAERFTEMMIVKKITERSEKEWNAVKSKYRLEERSKFEEQYALRTNNPELWKEYLPQIWLGVTERYGGDSLPEPEEKTVPSSRNLMSDMTAEFGLEDMEYEEEDSKDI